jgi:hypothetical protein
LATKIGVLGLLGICSLLAQHFVHAGAAEHGGHGINEPVTPAVLPAVIIRKMVREEVATTVLEVKAELKQMLEQIRTETQKLSSKAKNLPAADYGSSKATQQLVARATEAPLLAVQAAEAPLLAVQAAVEAPPLAIQAVNPPLLVAQAAAPSRNPSVPLDISETDPKSSAAADVMSWCKEVHKTHGVSLGHTWGSLSKQGQAQLKKNCKHIDKELGGGKGRIEGFTVDEYTSHIDSHIEGRTSDEHIIRTDNDTVVVAVCFSTTTRGLKIKALKDLAMIQYLLPSLLRTAETKFEYWVYVLFDQGDLYFDKAGGKATLLTHMQSAFHTPLSSKGVKSRSAVLRFANPFKKPGPAFNFMMGAAWKDGADYLYRVNDDTELKGAWASDALGQLRGFNPSNVGAVGPLCAQGNKHILTHDLVHRTHLDIFSHYYPPILCDWWMDDWITHVYGGGHTRHGPFEVVHHTDHQGRR